MDLEASRQFYEEFLGLEVIRTSHHSMMVRLGGDHVYAVVHTKKPMKMARHGTYSFHFWDRDENSWEILSNPRNGYTWIFDKGDLEGLGHFKKNFRAQRPDLLQQE